MFTKKSSILLILKVLEKYSDEEHYLTQQEIINKVYDEYGIELERKSVGSSINILKELGYDINNVKKSGFALYSRTFDYSEARFLIDAIFSSKMINGNQAKNLVKKVASCFSDYKRSDYNFYIYKTDNISRTTSKDVLCNVLDIQDAIALKVKITFQYLAYDKNGNLIPRKNDKVYEVSPYFLVNNFGRYYLVCHYDEKYGPITHFRLDYMKNIQILNDKPLDKLEDIDSSFKDFSIAKYINNHVYMFGGDVVTATVIIKSEQAISYVKDWFGKNSKIYDKDDVIYADITCNQKSLYYWIMQYSEFIKVVSPKSLCDQIKNGLKKALEDYQ